MTKNIDDKDLNPITGGAAPLDKQKPGSTTRPTGPLQGSNKDEVDGTAERD